MSNSLFQSDLIFPAKDFIARRELKQFLRFYLEPDTTVMLPVGQITEVLKIGIGQIVPLPHLPVWVMGVYNWRGNILWMLDLGHLIGLNSWYQQDVDSANYTAIVLKSDRTSPDAASLGLVVTRVEDIEWCNPNRIQALPNLAVIPALAPFLKGYWLKADSQTIFVLDGEAIAAAMPQTSNH